MRFERCCTKVVRIRSSCFAKLVTDELELLGAMVYVHTEAISFEDVQKFGA